MTTPLIGHISFYDMNMYFFIYAFLGWIAEVIYATLKTGKFVNRGFLNGPVCPIYGVGMAFIVLFLNPLADKWWLLFIVGALFATLLELVTGFVLDKLFHTKWWDYSKEHFNIKGYVCLRFTFIWGFAVLILFNTLVPLTDALISLIPPKWVGYSLLIAFWLIILTDFTATVIQLKGVKKDIKELDRLTALMHKNSDALGEKVSDITLSVSEKLKTLSEKVKNSRIGKAFPAFGKKYRGDDENGKKD